jgi:hypothetical protein
LQLRNPAAAVAQPLGLHRGCAALLDRRGRPLDVAALCPEHLSGADGGQWTADLTKEDGFVSGGLEGAPKLTVRCSGKDFTALVKGRKNAQMAVLSGELVLEPMNLDLVGTLAPLFA